MKIVIKNKESTKRIYGNKNDNLLKVLRKNHVEVNNNCGEKGKCGKCKVKILKYNNLKTTKSDEKYLSKEELEEKIRLACMVNLEDDMEIELINNKDNVHVLTDVYDNITNLDTNIKKHYIELKKPTLKDQRDDIRRLRESLNMNLEINIKDLQNISEILDENDYKITLTTYKNKLLHCTV